MSHEDFNTFNNDSLEFFLFVFPLKPYRVQSARKINSYCFSKSSSRKYCFQRVEVKIVSKKKLSKKPYVRNNLLKYSNKVFVLCCFPPLTSSGRQLWHMAAPANTLPLITQLLPVELLKPAVPVSPLEKTEMMIKFFCRLGRFKNK